MSTIFIILVSTRDYGRICPFRSRTCA